MSGSTICLASLNMPKHLDPAGPAAQRARVFWRFYAGLIVLVVLVGSAVAWAGIRHERTLEFEDAQNELRQLAYTMRALIEPALESRDNTSLQRAAELARTLPVRLTIVADDGRVLADSAAVADRFDNQSSRPEIIDAAHNGLGVGRRASAVTGHEMLFVAVPVIRRGTIAGFVRTSKDTGEIDTRIWSLQRRLIEAAVGFGLIAIIVAFSVTRRLDREFRRVAQLWAERNALEASRAAIARSEERFQLAARATSEAIWDWDAASDALWWNDGFRALFGHEASAAPTLERRIDLIRPADRDEVVASLREFLTSDRTVWTCEYRLQRADRSEAWVFDRAYVVRDEDGKPRRAIGSMMDITDRKQAERMKSDFVSFVSHQLRTPLAGLNWMLELAEGSASLPPDARQNIVEARESAARLVGLVNDLLDISRLESGRIHVKPVTIDLPALTRDVVEEVTPLVHDKGHDLRCDAADVDSIEADEQLLRQVIGNLLSNAIKYTPPGGRIGVTIRQDDGVVRWSIRDSGIGIPKQAQPRLFEKFFRADNAVATETEGTGLGLHLARLIVEQFGGQLWCESEEGQGTTFGFALPIGEER
jgi:PAS domain S-box-containing protein